MKKTYNLLIMLLVMLPLTLSACAGIVYHKSVDLGDGDQADVVGRTGAFGTDAVAIRFKNKAPEDSDILRLHKFRSRQATSQTYDQKCPDPKQLKNIQTRTENESEYSYEDVPNPNKRQDQFGYIGGSNPSTGNILLPAAAEGAGYAFSGGTSYLVQEGATALAKGGSSRVNNKNTNKNANINKNKNANKNANKNGNANKNYN